MPNTFPSTVQPTFPVKTSTKMRLRKAKFGDGYSQRSEDGINAEAVSWSLVFENLTTAEKDTVVNFLKAEKGVNVFFWTPPQTATQYKVTCEEWDAELVDAGYWSVTATFNREFDN